MESSGIEEVEI